MFVSADYRLLIPCTAHDQIADVRALSAFLSSDAAWNALPSGVSPDASAILASGSSAGVYVALQFALHAEPKPKGFLSLYGMLDPLADHFVRPHPDGIPLYGGLVSKEGMPRFVGADASPRPSSHSPFRLPGPTCEDGRHVLAPNVFQDGTLLDFIAGRHGLGAELARWPTPEARAQTLEEEMRAVFPILRAHELPPMFFVHGDADSVVPLDNAQMTLSSLTDAGIRNELIVLEGAEHGLRPVTGSGEAPGYREALQKAVLFLKSCL
jgi:acetyl esterase/lipase